MKKLCLLLALIGCISFSGVANQANHYLINENAEPTEVFSNEATIKVTILSTSSTAMELLVEASDALNDFCNYFDNSWADVGLTVYCAFAGTGVYGECVVYRAVKAMCGLNGVVRLTMEGDISNAIKKGLKTGTQIYSIVKQTSTAFRITEAMCSIEDKR